jgi:hypothetical protein
VATACLTCSVLLLMSRILGALPTMTFGFAFLFFWLLRNE